MIKGVARPADSAVVKANWLPFIAVSAAMALLLLLPNKGLGQGQAAFSSLNGEVHDSSGAVVRDAAVTVFSTATGIRRTYKTDAAGRYAFTQLPPGTYSLSVSQPGFNTYVQNGLALEIGQVATQDITLAIGNVNQEVVVTAEAPPLNTSNANLGADVSELQVTQLPLDYRAPFLLVTLLSSVNTGQIWQSFNSGTQLSGPGADQDASAFTFGGSRFGDTGFLLDGHWNGSNAWNAIMYSPSVDETQEFRIQQNVFTAQYGRSMGNVVNAITKSGTNKLHGDIFEFLRNSDLDANNFFNNRAGLAKPHFERNQFGATAGGPLWIPKLYEQTQKTFFFGGYEGLRQSTPLTAVLTVPLAPFRSGDFSSLLGSQIGTDSLGRPVNSGQIYNPFTTRTVTAGQVDPGTGVTAQQSGYVRDPFPGNRIPASLINPVAAKVLTYYPAPNGPGSVNNFTSTLSVPAYQDKYTLRIDQNITDSARLFVRWSQAFEYKTRNGAFFGADNPGGYGEQAGNNRLDLGLGFSYTFSPRFVMSAAAGVNRWVETRIEQGYPFPPSQLGLPSFFDTQSNQFPDFNISGTASLGGSSAQSHSIAQDQSASVDFTRVSGSHTIGFGYQYIFFVQNSQNANLGSFKFGPDFTQGPDPTTANTRTGYGFASFLLGTGNGGSFPLSANEALSEKYNAWYIQDEWKVLPKLTLTIGLRYDVQSAPTERYNRLSNFEFTGTNPIAPALAAANGGVAPVATPGYLSYLNSSNRSLYDPSYLNFAPRISVAYSPTNKLVVRSGFGTFYVSNYPLWSLPTQGFSQSTPYVGTVNGVVPVNTLSNPFPTGLILPAGSSGGGLTNVGQSITAVGRTRSSPYVEQWSFSTQYAFSANDIFELSYFGNHGLKLAFNDIQRNQLNPQYLSLGNALLAPVRNPFYGVISSSSCGLNQPTVPYGQLLRPYPQYCGVDDLQALGASSWYHAMTAQYNHRFSHGLQALASYTWSKYLDNSQGMQQWVSGPASSVTNWYNLAAQKSVDANDVPHSLVLSFVAELPFGKGKAVGSNWGRVANAVAGGWQLSGVTSFKSGLPLGMYASTNNTNSFGGGQRPNIIGDPSAVPAGTDRVNAWFNKAAFAQPAPFTFGNAPRFLSYPRGPGLQNIDLGLSKSFHLFERSTIQFRAESFNTINRANFYLPNTTFGDPSFGTVSQALPARDIQFGLKVLW
jgi:hypothetical protein